MTNRTQILIFALIGFTSLAYAGYQSEFGYKSYTTNDDSSLTIANKTLTFNTIGKKFQAHIYDENTKSSSDITSAITSIGCQGYSLFINKERTSVYCISSQTVGVHEIDVFAQTPKVLRKIYPDGSCSTSNKVQKALISGRFVQFYTQFENYSRCWYNLSTGEFFAKVDSKDIPVIASAVLDNEKSIIVLTDKNNPSFKRYDLGCKCYSDIGTYSTGFFGDIITMSFDSQTIIFGSFNQFVIVTNSSVSGFYTLKQTILSYVQLNESSFVGLFQVLNQFQIRGFQINKDSSVTNSGQIEISVTNDQYSMYLSDKNALQVGVANSIFQIDSQKFELVSTSDRSTGDLQGVAPIQLKNGSLLLLDGTGYTTLDQNLGWQAYYKFQYDRSFYNCDSNARYFISNTDGSSQFSLTLSILSIDKGDLVPFTSFTFQNSKPINALMNVDLTTSTPYIMYSTSTEAYLAYGSNQVQLLQNLNIPTTYSGHINTQVNKVFVIAQFMSTNAGGALTLYEFDIGSSTPNSKNIIYSIGKAKFLNNDLYMISQAGLSQAKILVYNARYQEIQQNLTIKVSPYVRDFHYVEFDGKELNSIVFTDKDNQPSFYDIKGGSFREIAFPRFENISFAKVQTGIFSITGYDSGFKYTEVYKVLHKNGQSRLRRVNI